MFKQKNHEISELMRKFNGQRAPGSLFGVDDEVLLPKFDSISEMETVPVGEAVGSMSLELDILAESAGSSTEENVTKWVVETKLSKPPRHVVGLVKAYAKLTNSEPWLVVFAKVPSYTRDEAKKQKVMISGLDELEKLKRLIMSTN